MRATFQRLYLPDNPALNRVQDNVNAVLEPVVRLLSDPVPWTVMAIQAGWVAVGTPYFPPAFRLDAFGVVWVRGAVQNASAADPEDRPIALLPLGKRPIQPVVIAVATAAAALGVVVGVDGLITPRVAAAASEQFHLNFSFPVT